MVKNNPITTTPKQSQKIIDLGFTPTSADFVWVIIPHIKPLLMMRSMASHYSDDYYKKIPAWSLSALVNFLPDGFTIPDDEEEDEDLALDLGIHYSLRMEKDDNAGYTIAYSVGGETLFMTVKDNLISAIVKTLEWLVKEQGWSAQVLIENIEEYE